MRKAAQFFRRWSWMLRHQRAERAEEPPIVDRLAETQKVPQVHHVDLCEQLSADDQYVFCQEPKCLAVSTLLTASLGWQFREFWIALPTPPNTVAAGLIKQECRCPIHRSEG